MLGMLSALKPYRLAVFLRAAVFGPSGGGSTSQRVLCGRGDEGQLFLLARSNAAPTHVAKRMYAQMAKPNCIFF